MESIATVLYARVRNVLAICNAKTPARSAAFVAEVRNALEGPISKQNGIVAMVRPDSILAVFSNEEEAEPTHARRALHAALVAVYEIVEMSKQLAMRAETSSLPPLVIAAGVHIGKVEVGMGAPGSTSGLIRATGEAVEIARALETAGPDMRWSIVASGAARRAAGARVESKRIGSVGMPDGGFVDVAEITGLAPMRTSRTPAEVYQAVRDAVSLNQSLYDRPQDILAAANTSRAAASQFTIAGYRILRKIGEGGMASIYLVGTDKPDEVQVLKVMPMGNVGQGDSLQRFMQEFALLAQLQHPNIAKIYRQDFSAGHAYIAMEYFSHGDLRARIAEGGIEPTQAIAYITQTAAALGAIHGIGIVHRDLKPDNLMLRQDGSLALTDFGVAKHVSILITETAHDEVVGTPYYLSPEQALGQPVDQRCDIYSLGVLFYELLTGSRPYRANTAQELLELHINGPVPLLRPPFDHLQPVLERLMAKDREQRYASAQEFLDDLARLGM